MKTKFFLVLVLLHICGVTYSQETLSLEGKWRFQLDSLNKGIIENWAEKKLPENICLPGTTDEAKVGTKTHGSDFGILTREYKYYGPAWYQQDIVIPDNWKGKHISLELERVLWESSVFLDGQHISAKDALNSPHIHDLGYLSPGRHTITARINNDMIYNIGDKGHVYTEYTQSVWNGAVGRIQLIARDKIRFSNPQVYTKISPRSVAIADTLLNDASPQFVTIQYELKDRLSGEVVFREKIRQKLEKGKNILNYSATLPDDIKLWNDVNPNLYNLTISIADKEKICDSRVIETGFREISISKSKILVNGTPVFLRGNLDCVHFPLTGYPSCKIEDWERIFRIYKEYGLNHVRFHSWCPPEAAFIAANRVGIYTMAETIWIDYWMSSAPPEEKERYTKGQPKGLGKNPSADEFIQKELLRMVEAYGNHPSFTMMCIGNELGNSDFEIMESWLKPIKERDNRRLYSVSTARKITPLDQYMATHHIEGLGATRGLRGASTDWDFEDVYSQSNIPVISHEIGQWPVYPLWSEIKKYKGVLKARNFEEFREQATANGLMDQNKDFTRASGALNQIMYKYEIESFLRTPSCAGIQLLSMQDYQGQGEALIGWLDVFYDSKGITTPAHFRSHMDTTVTLLRIPKYVWENNETFSAGIQIAHYGTRSVEDGVYWKIKDETSNLIASGNIEPRVYETGSSETVGRISLDLKPVLRASKLTIEVGLQNENIENRWNIWVYPSKPSKQETKPENIYVTQYFDKECISHLEEGGKVLLDASLLGTEKTADMINFYPLYWSLTFFPGQGKNTIGMLVQDKHPLFSQFPTEYHSDWQWQDIYKGARAFYINDYPENFKPIAQPIDDFHRNNKLASIFELKVGKGKLLICGFNINNDASPVARQLKHSMLNYMNTPAFNPVYEQDAGKLQTMLTYIQPLISEIPDEFKNASIYIDCNAENSGDNAIIKKGFDYESTYESRLANEKVTAWQGKEITLKIHPPKGIIGALYVCFENIGNVRHEADIVFEGRNYELKQNREGSKWSKFHLSREDSNDGELILKVNSKKENILISKVVLIEE